MSTIAGSRGGLPHEFDGLAAALPTRVSARLARVLLAGLACHAYNRPMGPPMLERDAELSVLADAVQAAAAGRGSVVLVFGEAGVGKAGPPRAGCSSATATTWLPRARLARSATW